METYKKINQINTNCGNCVVAKEKKRKKRTETRSKILKQKTKQS